MAAYVSLRFMAPTRATLGLARWPLSCSVEVAALRGTSGAEPLIHRLERVTRLRGGTVHWGQRNGLDPRAVRDTLGPDLDRWHAAVRQLDPHFVFSNPFSIDHGLDPHPACPGGTGTTCGNSVSTRRSSRQEPAHRSRSSRGATTGGWSR